MAQVVAIPLPPWPGSGPERFPDFPALLDHIVAEIELRIGDKPVMLFGLCFGGMLAHAVATRLAASGRDIGFLAILDGDAEWALGGVPSSYPRAGSGLAEASGSSPARLSTLARWIARHPRMLRWLGENRRMDRLPRKNSRRISTGT